MQNLDGLANYIYSMFVQLVSLAHVACICPVRYTDHAVDLHKGAAALQLWRLPIPIIPAGLLAGWPVLLGAAGPPAVTLPFPGLYTGPLAIHSYCCSCMQAYGEALLREARAVQ
jgi:hypothetical protein